MSIHGTWRQDHLDALESKRLRAIGSESQQPPGIQIDLGMLVGSQMLIWLYTVYIYAHICTYIITIISMTIIMTIIIMTIVIFLLWLLCLL